MRLDMGGDLIHGSLPFFHRHHSGGILSKMDPKKTPQKPNGVPMALLEWLKFRFPDRAPNPDDSDREVWMKAGNVEVVRHLQSLVDQQEAAANVQR